MNRVIDELVHDLEHAEIGSRTLDTRVGVAMGRSINCHWTRDVDFAMCAIPGNWAIAHPFRFKLEQKPVDSGPAWICEIRRHAEDGCHGIGYGAALAVCAAVLRLHQRISIS